VSEAKPEKLDSIWPTPSGTPETMGEAFVLDVVLAMEEYQCTDRADLLKRMRWGIKDDLAAIAVAVDARFGRMVEGAKAAGFIDDKGEVRKVLGTLPLTADGMVAGMKCELWADFAKTDIDAPTQCTGPGWPCVPMSRLYGSREAADQARRTNEAKLARMANGGA
jgi:hypothetical protein